MALNSPSHHYSLFWHFRTKIVLDGKLLVFHNQTHLHTNSVPGTSRTTYLFTRPPFPCPLQVPPRKPQPPVPEQKTQKLSPQVVLPEPCTWIDSSQGFGHQPTNQCQGQAASGPSRSRVTDRVPAMCLATQIPPRPNLKLPPPPSTTSLSGPSGPGLPPPPLSSYGPYSSGLGAFPDHLDIIACLLGTRMEATGLPHSILARNMCLMLAWGIHSCMKGAFFSSYIYITDRQDPFVRSFQISVPRHRRVTTLSARGLIITVGKSLHHISTSDFTILCLDRLVGNCRLCSDFRKDISCFS